MFFSHAKISGCKYIQPLYFTIKKYLVAYYYSKRNQPGRQAARGTETSSLKIFVSVCFTNVFLQNLTKYLFQHYQSVPLSFFPDIYSVGHWTRHQDANFTFGEMWQKLGRTHQVYVYCSVFLCNFNIMFYIFPSSTLQYWELGLESGQDWNCCRSVLHAIRPLFITGEKWPSRVTIHSTCAFVRI